MTMQVEKQFPAATFLVDAFVSLCRPDVIEGF